jgi:hypothetical protein
MAGIYRRGIRIPPSETEAEALQNALTSLENGARGVAKNFTRPDDDWRPVWLVVTADGHGTFLAPVSITGGRDKRAITARVAEFARSRGAVAIAHLHSSWVVTRSDVSEERHREIERHMDTHDGSTEGIPERREALLIAGYTATLVRIGMATITRHPDRPPTLGSIEFGEPDEWRGRMAEPLAEALRRIG